MRSGVVAAVLVLASPPAAALECFTLVSSPSALASSPGVSSTVPVTLATVLRTQAGCLYGLSPDAMAAVAAGDTDFATLALHLAERAHAPASTNPRSLFARRGTGPVESLFRESCTDLFVADRAEFYAHGDSQTRLPVVDRVHPAQGTPAPGCGAGHSTLRFLPLPEGASAPGLSRAITAHTLPTDRAREVLDAGASYAVYAGREGAAAGVLVGRITAGDPLTALRRAFATPADPDRPWLRARWTRAGAFRWSPGGLPADALAELTTAADAGALWLADVPTGDAPPRVHGALHFDADGLQVPDAVVTDALARRYGRAADGLAPTLDEWDQVRRGLSLCLADRYGSTRAEAPGFLPPGARCARLSAVAAPVALASVAGTGTRAGQETAPRGLCFQRRMTVLTADGVGAGGALPELCRTLPSAAGDPEGTAPAVVAQVGDRLTPQGATDGLYVCLDNDCRALAEDTSRELWRAGALELRQAGSAETARSPQSVALLRALVIDPARHWLPVGLRLGDGPTDPQRPWASLDHDEPEVFAFVRGRSALSFRFVTSALAAAVWNAPDAPSVLTDDVPVVGGVRGAPAAPPSSALVALVSRDTRCPSGSAAGVRARVPPDPDGLLVDQTFQVFLARYQDDTAPYECLARASFRVREARALAPSRWLHAGLLGDVHLAAFFTAPASLGALLPVGYVHGRLPYGLGLDATVSLASAVSFEHAQVTRAGVGLTLGAGWGPLSVAPRLVTLGVMVHLSTGTGENEPWFSPYAALDLSTLVDLAGGR